MSQNIVHLLGQKDNLATFGGGCKLLSMTGQEYKYIAKNNLCICVQRLV